MVIDPSYLFNAASLNDTISHSDFTASCNWVTVHTVLESLWKESVEPWLKVVCRIFFSGGNEKNHEKPLSERWVFQATFEMLTL